MTRPRGEIRAALVECFGQRGPATWREVLPDVGVDVRSRSEVLMVRRTVENMVRVGELEVCGRHKLPGEHAWRSMYELAERKALAPRAVDPLDALERATRCWANFD